MNTQNGVLKTLATEQKVLHDISVARAAVQETTLSSMQQLLHLEQVSGRKIKEAFCLIDLTGGRDKVMMIESSRDHHLHHQQAAAAAAAAVAVSSNPLLEGVAKKHTQELMEAEKKLGITNLERLEQAQDVATMELCSVQPQDKKGHQKSLSLMDRQILLMGNSFAVDETEETASAGTTAQEVCTLSTRVFFPPNLSTYLTKLKKKENPGGYTDSCIHRQRVGMGWKMMRMRLSKSLTTANKGFIVCFAKTDVQGHHRHKNGWEFSSLSKQGATQKTT